MDGKRGAQRRPLSELDAEQVAERSVQGDVVDEVCRRLSLLQTARPRRHQSKGVRLGSVCLLYTSPSPRDVEESRMPSSA